MKFVFDNPSRFVSGTVGQPGERAFFLQVKQDSRLISVSLEKLQLQALAERISVIISEVRKSSPLVVVEPYKYDDAPLDTPIEEEFQVGAISVSWVESEKVINLNLFEVEDEEEDSDLLDISLTLGMSSAFVKRSLALIKAGRLPCPFCGNPIDARGHLCPRANGYRR